MIRQTILLLSLFLLPAFAQAELSPNQIAHLLAGVKLQDAYSSDESRAIQDSRTWINQAESASVGIIRNASSISGKTNLLHINHIAHMRATMNTHAPETQTQTQSVLYFFGGPDFLYPDALFPQMTNLILVGTEPVGELSGANIVSRMEDIYLATRDSARFSYFITDKMQAHLPGGVTTILAASIAETEANITSLDKVAIQEDGSLTPSSSGTGVRIEYTKADGTPAVVYYFQQNLGGGSYNGLPGLNSPQGKKFIAFVKAVNPDTAFYKASSFLSHSSGMSIATRLVMDEVDRIVQSDDGIPLATFDANWDLDLLGYYIEPIVQGGTHFRLQPDLQATYAQLIQATGSEDYISTYKKILGNSRYQNAAGSESGQYSANSVTWLGPLDFPIGYTYTNSHPAGGSGLKKISVNLMVAKKR